MEEKKKPSKKISTVFLILGVLVAIAGVVMIVKGLEISAAAEAEYAQWRKDWMDGLAEFEDAPPAFNNTLWVMGAFVCFLSLPLFVIGLMPYIAKLNAKLGQEVLGHAGNDIKEASKMGAETISPAVTEVAKAVKDGLKDTKFCMECGKEIPSGAKFCPECGAEQKK